VFLQDDLNEMDTTCSMHVGDEKFIQHFYRKTTDRKFCLADLRVDGRIILKWISENVNGFIWLKILSELAVNQLNKFQFTVLCVCVCVCVRKLLIWSRL